MKNRSLSTYKRWTVAVVAVVFSLFALNVQAQDRTLSNGFSLHLVLGTPSSTFGAPSNDQNDIEKFGFLYGLEIGSRWYFGPTDTWGIGLMVNWFDVTYSVSSDEFAAADVSFLELGPLFTYAIAEDMGLDAYYNLRPTFLALSDYEDFGYAGFGLTNAVGVAYRYKVFSVGIETVFGGVNSALIDENTTSLAGDIKLKNNSTRFVLGFKF